MIVKEKIGKKLFKKLKAYSGDYAVLDLKKVAFPKKDETIHCLTLLSIISYAENANNILSKFDPSNPIITDSLFKAMQVLMSDQGGLSKVDMKDYLHTIQQIEGFMCQNNKHLPIVSNEAELLILGISKKNLHYMPDDKRREAISKFVEIRADYIRDETKLDSCADRLWELVERYNKTKEEFKKERLAEHDAYMDKEDDKLRRQGVVLQEIKEKVKNGDSISLAERCFLDPKFIDKIKLPEESLKEMTSSLIN